MGSEVLVLVSVTQVDARACEESLQQTAVESVTEFLCWIEVSSFRHRRKLVGEIERKVMANV